MEFIDAVALGDTRLTRDGYLVVEAKVARTGVQVYRGEDMGRPEMTAVRVLRPEEEVFSKDALSSFAHRPVTNDHPKHLVDARNWKNVAIGMTGDKVVRDGDYVQIPFTLMDSKSIAEVNGGKRQLSMGYTAAIDWTSGETSTGEHFDAIQREIVGNHLAVVDVARAGPRCRIGDSFSAPPPPETNVEDRTMAEVQLRTVVVDGFTIQVNDQGAQAIDKLQKAIADAEAKSSRRDEEIASMRDSHKAVLESTVQAKDGEAAGLKAIHDRAIEAKDGEIAGLKASHQSALDALNGEVAGLKAAQPNAEQMDALIAARAGVIDSARKILGDKFDPKGKSDAEIRRMAVEKRLGTALVADKSDEWIGPAFVAITVTGSAPAGRDPVRDHFTAPATDRPRATPQDADDAHGRYVDRLENGWRHQDEKETV